MAKVAVVILSWKGKKFLEQFLPGILKSLPPYARLIIADNASNDGVVEWIRETYDSVQVIAFQKNLGFAGGYNQVLGQLDDEYFVLLNQDVEVTPNWLEPLVNMADNDLKIGAIQPKIKWQLNKDYFEYAGAAGGWIDKNAYAFCRGRIFDIVEKDHSQFEDEQEIFWASGACMFVRRKVFETCGGLDDDFFAHMEEIDLCWRIHRAGFQIMYCPQSTVYHVGGGSLPQGNPFKTYLNFRNSLVLILKNEEPNKIAKKIFVRLILDNIAALKSLLNADFKSSRAIVQAEIDFLRKWSYWKSKRNKSLLYLPLKKMPGVYTKSLLWQYFINRKKYFNDIFKH